MLHAASLVFAIGITVALFLWVDKETIRRFQQWGYFGMFLISLIGNASLGLPIPSLFFTFVGGSTLNWVIVGLVSGLGAGLGESTGYMVGYGGGAVIENNEIYRRMQRWMEKYGGLTIFVLGTIPNPLIDVAGIAAGASHFGYWRFVSYCTAGKTVKTLVTAYAGAHSITWLLHYMHWFGG